jgi:hypothetical protein
VAELQARMSSREFSEWAAYYEIEPWGPEYDALERATIAAVVANTARDQKKRSQPYRPEEFMARFKARKQKGVNNLLQKVETINRMMGGRDDR